MYLKILEDNDYLFSTGTSLAGYLESYTYDELVNAFGEPTYPEASGDDKVQKEWVFVNRNNSQESFTLYDWKTYDEEYTKTKCTRWHIGSKHSNCADFLKWLEDTLNAKRD